MTIHGIVIHQEMHSGERLCLMKGTEFKQTTGKNGNFKNHFSIFIYTIYTYKTISLIFPKITGFKVFISYHNLLNLK